MTKKMWKIYIELTEENCKIIEFRHIRSHGKDGWQKKSKASYEYFCYNQNDYVDNLANYARTKLKIGQNIIEKALYDDKDDDDDDDDDDDNDE